jgi:hypothetical protein
MSLLHRMAFKRAISYEILNFVASGNLTVTNNGTTSVDVAKTSGSNSWDNHAYVATPFTAPITLEFNKQASTGDNGASYAMISLNEDPLTDASYSSLDYAAYPYRTDTYSVYHNNNQVLFSGAWNTALTFYITYRADGQLLHYNGSTQLYSVAWGAGKTVYIDSSFYSVNSTFSRFFNIRAIKKVWNGTAYI